MLVGVGGGGEHRGDRGAVQDRGLHAERGQGGGGVLRRGGGPPVRGLRPVAVDDDGDGAPQRIAAGGEVVEELGVVGARRRPGPGWRAAAVSAMRCGVAGQVDPLRGHDDLDRAGQAVEPPAVGAEQRRLLVAGAQADVDGGGGDHRAGVAGRGR